MCASAQCDRERSRIIESSAGDCASCRRFEVFAVQDVSDLRFREVNPLECSWLIAAVQVQRSFLLLALISAITAVLFQPARSAEFGWPPTSDVLEACIVAEERSYATGHACIGKAARQCLEVAQREPIVHVEKCYEPELAAWARLVNRYFGERPKDARGHRIAEVQRAWLGYRKLKCDHVDFHHGGGELGRSQSLICLLEETGRRALELRSFRRPQ